MSDQRALAGSADAQQHFMVSQVELFLFDLKNEAAEHGFGNSETWNLQLATEDEMVSLKKLHHPVVSLRLQPHALLKIYQQVKNKLQQTLSSIDSALTADDLIANEKRHLAAYPERSNRK